MPHKEMKALFDESKKPTHASNKVIRDQLRSILTVATNISRQMGLYREHHLNAKLSPHDADPAIDGKLELISIKTAAAEKACTDFIGAGTRLADIMGELEAAIAEAEADLKVYEAKKQ